jgi:hypothetical protein
MIPEELGGGGLPHSEICHSSAVSGRMSSPLAMPARLPQPSDRTASARSSGKSVRSLRRGMPQCVQ